mmetsp:Transcript_123043/g.347742  ORF Transcript_123043/g.347742 Transcript_123043/m.347742 type:complete len:271 (-) Transcript_123043:69-881(-)
MRRMSARSAWMSRRMSSSSTLVALGTEKRSSAKSKSSGRCCEAISTRWSTSVRPLVRRWEPPSPPLPVPSTGAASCFSCDSCWSVLMRNPHASPREVPSLRRFPAFNMRRRMEAKRLLPRTSCNAPIKTSSCFCKPATRSPKQPRSWCNKSRSWRWGTSCTATRNLDASSSTSRGCSDFTCARAAAISSSVGKTVGCRVFTSQAKRRSVASAVSTEASNAMMASRTFCAVRCLNECNPMHMPITRWLLVRQIFVTSSFASERLFWTVLPC